MKSIAEKLINTDIFEIPEAVNERINDNIENIIKDNMKSSINSENMRLEKSKIPLNYKVIRHKKIYDNDKKRKTNLTSEGIKSTRKTVFSVNNLIRKISNNSKEITNRRLFLNTFEYIKYYLCCIRKESIKLKLEFLRKLEETLYESTDIIHIISSFQQIEILKSIYLKGRYKSSFNTMFDNAFNSKIGISLIQNLIK